MEEGQTSELTVDEIVGIIRILNGSKEDQVLAYTIIEGGNLSLGELLIIKAFRKTAFAPWDKNAPKSWALMATSDINCIMSLSFAAVIGWLLTNPEHMVGRTRELVYTLMDLQITKSI